MKQSNIHPYIYIGLNASRKIQILNKGARDTGEMNIILKEVCNYCNVSAADFMSKRRHRPIVDARFLFTGTVLTHCKYTLEHIAKFINRDHSSVLYYKSRCDDITSVIPSFKAKFEDILSVTTASLEEYGFDSNQAPESHTKVQKRPFKIKRKKATVRKKTRKAIKV
jgi:hypothetical protein